MDVKDSPVCAVHDVLKVGGRCWVCDQKKKEAPRTEGQGAAKTFSRPE